MTERGSATILAIAAVSVALFGGVGLLSMYALAAERVVAQTAADAAALAAAPATLRGDGHAAATRLAAANGARLVECRCPFDPRPVSRQVQVGVAVDATIPVVGAVVVMATGRAEFEPRVAPVAGEPPDPVP